MKTSKEKVSYCIGLETSRSLKNQFSDLDLNLVTEGFKDGLSSISKLSDEEVRTLMQSLRQQIESQQKEYVAQVARENKAAGEAFLAQNKNLEGVIALASGLQYKVLHAGNGASPTLVDVVSAHYKGMFLDGKIFDSSYDRGKPQTFPVNRVIPGWSEALQLMKVGDKWQLFIPSYLGYGEMGFGNQIPPNATLIFEMELVSIN